MFSRVDPNGFQVWLNSTLLLEASDMNPTPPQEANDVVIYGAKLG
jgi:hypothetical protein